MCCAKELETDGLHDTAQAQPWNLIALKHDIDNGKNGNGNCDELCLLNTGRYEYDEIFHDISIRGATTIPSDFQTKKRLEKDGKAMLPQLKSQCPEGVRLGLLRSSAASLEKQALVNKCE